MAVDRVLTETDTQGQSWASPGNLFGNPSALFRFREDFKGVLAASATSIDAAEDLSAALPITCTISQPDVPRTVVWSLTHANITKFTIVITGIDAAGRAQTVTITDAAGWSGETSIAFAVISSVKVTGRTGTGAGDTLSLGVGSKLGLSNDVAAQGDVYKVSKVPLLTGLAADYSGTGNVTVDATNNTVDVSTGAAITAGDDFSILYRSYFTNIL
jgi:hypothetical protein